MQDACRGAIQPASRTRPGGAGGRVPLNRPATASCYGAPQPFVAGQGSASDLRARSDSSHRPFHLVGDRRGRGGRRPGRIADAFYDPLAVLPCSGRRQPRDLGVLRILFRVSKESGTRNGSRVHGPDLRLLRRRGSALLPCGEHEFPAARQLVRCRRSRPRAGLAGAVGLDERASGTSSGFFVGLFELCSASDRRDLDPAPIADG